jgi:protein-S-isoprenylcysteine O-methyltransferase Ste14
MIIETLAMLEMVSGIPSEALLSAPLAMGAAMHVVKAQAAQDQVVHTSGAWKGQELRKPLLSPGFIEVATLGLVFGAVIGVAALTGWFPGMALT